MFFYLVIIAGSAIKEQRDANRARIELLERSQKLEWEIIGISEREQQRIGRDLHDGLGQYLVAIGMAADSLKDDLEKDAARGAGEVGKIADLLHNAVVRTRDLARGLSPVDRDEGGLEASLEELASSATKISGIPCSFIRDGPPVAENETRDLHLFRIAQEALNNALKHARPKLVVIALESGDGALSLRVSDDGIGLEPNHFKKLGMGLNIMQYRAGMVEGRLEIGPNSPTGTVVSCTINGTKTLNE
jgi:signal transduction histidine kinase